MQHKRHTWISIVSDHVNEWRLGNNWSRETVAEEIVDKYLEIYPKGLPGVVEFSNHSDIFTRNQANATRIFRWLDDRTKDKNFLDANFLHVIVQSLPPDLRVRCINEMIRSMSLVASVADEAQKPQDDKPVNHLKALIKEGSEACGAITELLDGATPDEWVKAQQELIQLADVVAKARALVDPQVSSLNVKLIQGKKQ